MLKPAILYKEEIENKFKEDIYTERYFLYSGYPYSYSLPNIELQDNVIQYAIVSNDEVVGYIAYHVDPYSSCVYNFGLYSFSEFKIHSEIGLALRCVMEMLLKSYHRVSWRMIGGNPVKRHYDKFCEMHGGVCYTLHDSIKDEDGNYRDEYLYEIISKEV